MSGLRIVNARVLTMGETPGARRGAACAELGVVPLGTVTVEGDRVASVEAQEGTIGVEEEIEGGAPSPCPLPLKGERGGTGPLTLSSASRGEGGETVVDARGRVVMPAFVDAHTHACWAGERLDEFDRKQAGATYLEILESGGGIMSTVRAVRAASEDALRDSLVARLRAMAREGTLTVEVKSGYGLTTGDELKMLRAIDGARRELEGWVAVVPTALLGHAIDREQDGFVERTIGETLPAVSAEFPGIAVDAYCERSAWSLEDCARLFDRAQELGHPCRVHADQFNSLGMTRRAIERGFLSVDHLEATTPDDLRALAESDLYGVMLPCSGFHVDDRYADGRALVDAGGAPALATNVNPGSAPCSSMPFAVALAVRKCGLTAAEALAACTANGAALLGFEDRGRVAPGMRADLAILRHTDERMLGYEYGGNPVDVVVCGGALV